ENNNNNNNNQINNNISNIPKQKLHIHNISYDNNISSKTKSSIKRNKKIRTQTLDSFTFIMSPKLDNVNFTSYLAKSNSLNNSSFTIDFHKLTKDNNELIFLSMKLLILLIITII